MYVGDHVYADVLASKRKLAWRTCLIIPELSSEIIAHKRSRKLNKGILGLRREQFTIENQVSKFFSLVAINYDECNKKIASILTAR